MIDCTWHAKQPTDAVAGDCFPCTKFWRVRLSLHFLEHVAAERDPIVVMLPARIGGPFEFCIDSYPTDDATGAWKVTVAGELVAGAQPDITVEPSINAAGLYHGYLTHGTITDDLGG